MKSRLASFPAWSLVSLALTFIPLLTLEALKPSTRLIGYALAALIVAWIAVSLLHTGARLQVAGMTIAIAALVLYAFLLVPRSPLPEYMIERPACWLLGLLVLLVVQISLQRGARPSHWENALLASGVLISLVCCLLIVLWFRQWNSVVGSGGPPVGFRLPGIFVGHPNVIAGYLNLLLPLVVTRLVTPRRWVTRILLLSMMALFLITEYFASSRGGWLGGAAGIAVSIGLLAWPWARRTLKAHWQRSRARTSAMAVVLVVALGAAALGAYALFSRQASRTYHAPVATARSDIWGPAVEIIRASPVLGHGVGAFVVRFAEATQIPPGFSTNHAHNLALQIMAETGIVGLVGALAAGALGLWGVAPAIRRALSQADPALAAYLGAFTALLAHHSVDYLFNVTSYLLAVMILAALTVSHPLAQRRISAAGIRVAAPMIVASALVACIAVWAVRGERPYLGGLEAHRQSDASGASRSICLAAAEVPDVSLFGFQCALATATRAALTESPAAVNTAIDVLRSALSRDPSWPMHRANLAGLEWAAGQYDQAIEDLRSAVMAAPRHAVLSVNLGWMLEQAGRGAEALEAYRNALAYDSLLPETPFFAATALRRQAVSSFVSGERFSDADLLVGEGRQAITSGQPERALPLLDQAVAFNPLDASTFAWRAKALADMGLSDEAWRDIQTALFVDSDSWEALALGAVVAEQTGRLQDAYRLGRALHDTLEAASSSTAYYAELYRRPHLPYDVVPQLIRAVPTREMLAALELAATSYTQRGQEAEARAARAWMLEE